MTTLISKFQEITKRLQQLTVWRPNERDPFYELDRWRTDAHTTIEQIYNRKRQQIEQLIDKHEREFMRQISRQRLLLNIIRKRLLSQKEMNTDIRVRNETSISTDLKKIENDINTKLGPGDIVIEIIPLDLEDSVIVGLKTYLSATSSMYFTEMPVRNQPKKPIPRSTDEVKRAYDKWLHVKKNEEVITAQRYSQSARQNQQYAQEYRSNRQKSSKRAYGEWLDTKKANGAFIKKNLSINEDDIKQETNGT
jgi:hypothetical protein